MTTISKNPPRPIITLRVTPPWVRSSARAWLRWAWRASRIPAKHFEPQPDTLRVLTLSVLPAADGFLPLADLLDRLFDTWGITFGGRPEDADLLGRLGYVGLDQDRNLTPNATSLVNLLAELGLATRFSDGLVMCHSQPRF